MRFEPTSLEMLIGIAMAELPSSPSDLTDESFRVSGSGWNDAHLKALRVIRLDHLDFDKLLPTKYLPSETDEGFQHLAESLCAPTEEELKTYASRARFVYSKNDFHVVFGYIARAISKRTAVIPRTSAYQLEGIRSETPECVDSRSSEEDKREDCSRTLLQLFVTQVLDSTGKDLSPYGFSVVPEDTLLPVKIGPTARQQDASNVWNDGGFHLISVSDSEASKSDRYDSVPLISFEAKRRHAGGLRTPTGQPEPYNKSTFAQEVAELLGQAQNQAAMSDRPGPQEAFVLTIHGTKIRLVTAYFTLEYLECVEQERMPLDQHLWVRRSRLLDMKSVDGRKQALKLVVGLLKYIYCGESEIEAIRAVSAHLKEMYKDD